MVERQRDGFEDHALKTLICQDEIEDRYICCGKA